MDRRFFLRSAVGAGVASVLNNNDNHLEEKFKQILFLLDRDADKIVKDTKRRLGSYKIYVDPYIDQTANTNGLRLHFQNT